MAEQTPVLITFESLRAKAAELRGSDADYQAVVITALGGSTTKRAIQYREMMDKLRASFPQR